MKEVFIKHLIPYGYLHKSLFWKVIQRYGKYYLLDKFGSRFIIDEKTYKEYKK